MGARGTKPTLRRPTRVTVVLTAALLREVDRCADGRSRSSATRALLDLGIAKAKELGLRGYALETR